MWPEQAENFHGTGSPGGSAPVLLRENWEEPNLTKKGATGGPAHSVRPWPVVLGLMMTEPSEPTGKLSGNER